jgi:hypothetical protein
MLLFVFLLATFGVNYLRVESNKTPSSTESKVALSLSRPSFLSSASVMAAANLSQEAGISLYLYVPASLDLSLAYNAMGQVEYNTSNYVIGSLDTRMKTTLSTNDFPHCFVYTSGTNGWIVIYYLYQESSSKIIDWDLYSSNQLHGTFLSEGMTYMASQLGISPSTVSNAQYYHFQYSSATTLQFIIKHADTGQWGNYTITIPLGTNVFETSWSCTNNNGYGWGFYIDNLYISSAYGRVYKPILGGLTDNFPHIISIQSANSDSNIAYDCIMLLY